jgi:hypothetical protein
VLEYETPRFHYADWRRTDVAGCCSGATDRPCRRVRLFRDKIQRFGTVRNGVQRGLQAVGFVDGQNVTVEYHFPGGHDEGLPTLMAELVRRGVAVIFGDTSPAIAAKKATSTIPIVSCVGSRWLGSLGPTKRQSPSLSEATRKKRMSWPSTAAASLRFYARDIPARMVEAVYETGANGVGARHETRSVVKANLTTLLPT